MASDYKAIRVDNERRYGTDIGRIGPMLLANRYDDRTHFIYELLQNAEDALGRRLGWRGSRSIEFALGDGQLTVKHYGKPFDERDVRGICGIAESTKDLTAIGRFGIGFKSVYAFSDRPEVHSGDEEFLIESFVWPVSCNSVERIADETVFLLPLRQDDEPAVEEITQGLAHLGPRTLLFLRHVEEIAWRVEGGPSGLYLRSKPVALDDGVRRVELLGEAEGKEDVSESWLVFSRTVTSDELDLSLNVEAAFCLTRADDKAPWSVQAQSESPLVVFFPTVVATHLGFLVQGPYRTTPSRDNVPPKDSWNQQLVAETSVLVTDALDWLRDHDLLGTSALHCLPLNRSRFENGMFMPLFEATKTALMTQALLPRFRGGHVAGANASMARTQELRELFSPSQLGTLLEAEGDVSWLSGDITLDRAPELRRFLMEELEVEEITPERIVNEFTEEFLESQTDEWMLRLYEFLNGQPALFRHNSLDWLPIVRLEDGTHVTAKEDGRPQAFLPSNVETEFPTVRASVCSTEEARAFLRSLGLTEPDPVDDVVWNVLPRYAEDDEAAEVDDATYEADVSRILNAYSADSKTQRDKLVEALRETAFVKAIDAGTRERSLALANKLYIATERLRELFAGVENVLVVDDSYDCLRGERVRELLVDCGAARYLHPVPIKSQFSWEELREMRRAAGCENSSRREVIEDYALRGVRRLLALLPTLDVEDRIIRAGILWDALSDVQDRRVVRAFTGSYRWFFFNPQSCEFDTSSVRLLNDAAWVPDADGELQRPEFVVFESLGWKDNPFLLSKIEFKPPIIETLAKEVGIESGALDLLLKLGVTSLADLRSRLGIEEELETSAVSGSAIDDEDEDEDDSSVEDAVAQLLGEGAPDPTAPIPDPLGPESTGAGAGGGAGTGTGSGDGGGTGGSTNNGAPGASREGHRGDGAGSGTHGSGRTSDGRREGGGKRTPGSQGGRPFISYVATHPDDEGPDPDGLDQEARMELEENAILFIIEEEPELERTPTHNPGFDLTEPNQNGTTIRWVEVKAMTGSLRSGSVVGMSHTQFKCAQEHREAYWLYVVERADGDARLVRIQDPAGKARTFTFDHGWLAVAEGSEELDDREDAVHVED